MEELIGKGFVAPSTNAPLYFINPAIFFNGDRVRFVTEIRRKKLSAQERLEQAGQAALPLITTRRLARSGERPPPAALCLAPPRITVCLQINHAFTQHPNLGFKTSYPGG